MKNLWQWVMQRAHGGLAPGLLVLNAKEAYFACIGSTMRTETNRG
jgi:hypothetical protein